MYLSLTHHSIKFILHWSHDCIVDLSVPDFKTLCNVHFLLDSNLSWLLLLCVNKFSYTSTCFPPLSWNKVKSQIIVSLSLCLWSKFDQKSIVSSIPFHQQYIHIRCNIRRKVVLNTWRKVFLLSTYRLIIPIVSLIKRKIFLLISILLRPDSL